MISHILVPTDFSPVADNALDFAIDLARKSNAVVHVVHVKSIPLMDASFPAETYQLYVDEIENAAKQGLDKIENTRLKGKDVKYELHHFSGFVNDEIADFTEEHKVDMIVMGTTGASGLQEILIGSNTASVVSRSHVPVFVIPPSAKHIHFKQILYASDYSEPEFPAMARLMYIADLYDAKVTVLHIKTESDRYFDSEHNYFARNIKELAADKISVVDLEGVEITEGIDEYINEKGVDMVVMAKHSRSWFDRLFHRSLSKQMSYHTRVPLLVLNK